MLEQQKTLYVKEWLASKKSTEAGRHGSYTSTIWGILGETEKAAKVFVAADGCGILTYWVPKSQIVTELNGDEVADLTGFFRGTYQEINDRYNEIMEWYR